ncbi:MAG: hypothetical protein KBF21_12620 [Thermoanaerobaculia bacterium]|nr:hypothetical protein [Thermoanaerobaculia bacterium]MBP9825061.1 hypothetical protein [Thermoanaerobaculia bacterium]
MTSASDLSAGTDTKSAETRLRVALDLVEAGLEIHWWRLRREHPEATDAEIDALQAAWLRAPRGDAGRPSTRPSSATAA